ncbi:MAG: ATP-binding protein [Phycisphaerales bacterium]|nr:ATP-binding protein [Phycisphaerales bacterium]
MPKTHTSSRNGSQGLLFDPRFLETYAGERILKSPRTAIVELVANCWDAGATRVRIRWPDPELAGEFTIEDDGEGMTEDDFTYRWRTLAYNRLREQGPTVTVAGHTKQLPRKVFGRNGIGRFAGFCFGDEYSVETWREGKQVIYRVARGDDQPLNLGRVSRGEKRGHGTRLFVATPRATRLSAEDARAEIGMRFLTDPNFAVELNGQIVELSHIEEGQLQRIPIAVPDVGSLELIAIDVGDTDRTTRQHGVAWHVNGRLVGDCSWKSHGREDLIDGRRIAAKRYTFIVKADCLADAVNKDWTGFDAQNSSFATAAAEVYERINDFFLRVSVDDRKDAVRKAREANRETVSKLSLREAEKWERFVENAQVECPSLRERDLVKLSTVLANLEAADSRYALLHRLGELSTAQLDDLHGILRDWTLDMAKVVLDEIQTRMLLLDELKRKVEDTNADEVRELQPLFKRGLWIFGPEFETIEFTSNEGMTTVIQRLFGKDIPASRHRPDFAILPDGTVGLYAYPRFDPSDGGEIGVNRLVIIELKRSGIRISTEQKDQCWKYVKELIEKGLLLDDSRVTCFPLGSHIDLVEADVREERHGLVRIQPLSYDTVITRAKSRMLRLYDRIKNAPFLDKEKLTEFLARGKSAPGTQQSLQIR